jgi:hypothetical protein
MFDASYSMFHVGWHARSQAVSESLIKTLWEGHKHGSLIASVWKKLLQHQEGISAAEAAVEAKVTPESIYNDPTFSGRKLLASSVAEWRCPI